jgi:CheY-like chemotaxis protein
MSWETMQRQPLVLMISHQRTMRHLTERVCRQVGAQTVPATSGQEANAIAAERGLHAFALIVIDTAEPGREHLSQPRMARHLFQEWTAALPLLPFVWIGPVSQKSAVLRIRADIVRYVPTPVSLPALREAIASCLLKYSPMARNFSVACFKEGTPNDTHHYGPNHPGLSRRDAAVQDGVARGAFSATASDQSGMVPHGQGRRGPDVEWHGQPDPVSQRGQVSHYEGTRTTRGRPQAVACLALRVGA